MVVEVSNRVELPSYNMNVCAHILVQLVQPNHQSSLSHITHFTFHITHSTKILATWSSHWFLSQTF